MTLLMLAGTGEARRIAGALAGQGRPAIASLAGATRRPEALPLPTRIGGFGGADGFLAYLEEAKISAVLDATHPYARRIGPRSARLCAQAGLPYCRVLRQPWVPGPEDDWHEIATPEDAAALVPLGACVFLATGRQTLAEFACLQGRRVIARVVDPPEAPFPFEGGEYLIGRPPFSEERDLQILATLGVDWIVAKNSGGVGGVAKLAAARALGIPVALLARPPRPHGPVVETVDQALHWVAGL